MAAPGGGTSAEPSSDSDSESEQEREGKLPKGGSSSSSDSESDSGSESRDSEGEEEGKAAPAAGGSSDGSDESSDSDDESSSESESEAEDGGKAAARPAQQQQQQPWQQPQQHTAPAPAAAAPAAAPAAGAADDEDEDGEFVPRRVYVGGMPFSYTEDKVRSRGCRFLPDVLLTSNHVEGRVAGRLLRSAVVGAVLELLWESTALGTLQGEQTEFLGQATQLLMPSLPIPSPYIFNAPQECLLSVALAAGALVGSQPGTPKLSWAPPTKAQTTSTRSPPACRCTSTGATAARLRAWI